MQKYNAFLAWFRASQHHSYGQHNVPIICHHSPHPHPHPWRKARYHGENVPGFYIFIVPAVPDKCGGGMGGVCAKIAETTAALCQTAYVISLVWWAGGWLKMAGALVQKKHSTSAWESTWTSTYSGVSPFRFHHLLPPQLLIHLINFISITENIKK